MDPLPRRPCGGVFQDHLERMVYPSPGEMAAAHVALAIADFPPYHARAVADIDRARTSTRCGRKPGLPHAPRPHRRARSGDGGPARASWRRKLFFRLRFV